MIVKEVHFIAGAARPAQFPPAGLPEIAVAGRSNVGKSSLINALLGRKDVARVSSTPGRTQQINFFKVNDAFLLADLPGYGFARASRSTRADWGNLIPAYIEGRDTLRGVLLLCDLRRAPEEEEHLAVRLIQEAEIPLLIVLTKADKLPLQQRLKQRESVMSAFHLQPKDGLLTSAEKGWGKEDLWQAITGLIS